MAETLVRQRLLIVDDDPNIVAGLEALLADDWEVKTAMTTRDGRAVFADFSPDNRQRRRVDEARR
jgi:DNA-binding response OmpR family regulator